jgi:arginine decarboxylase
VLAATVLKQREDILGTTSASSLVYATLDGWRRNMALRGHDLLQAALARASRNREHIGGLHGVVVLGDEFVGPSKAFDHDRSKICMDVSGLGITGFQASEWLRAKHHVDLGAMDTRRIQADITIADDDETDRRLLDALTDLARRADEIERPPHVELPQGHVLELEQVMRPRDAFFARVEQVPLDKAPGRVAAEMVSPYPPGVPVIAPGERITQEVLDYLTDVKRAGALLPDPADNEFESLRVVA